MDIQSIVDFMDLVKNPKKYEVYVSALEERQAKLTETIENVAKATELDNLIYQNKVAREELEKSYSKKEEELAKAKETQTTEHQRRMTNIEKDSTETKKLLADSKEKFDAAQQTEVETQTKLKAVMDRESKVATKEVELDNLIADYKSKIAKFKELMG